MAAVLSSINWLRLKGPIQVFVTSILIPICLFSQDYQQEFTKTSARVSARREREELLGGNSPPPSAVSGLNRRDQYAKESGHLHRSLLARSPIYSLGLFQIMRFSYGQQTVVIFHSKKTTVCSTTNVPLPRRSSPATNA